MTRRLALRRFPDEVVRRRQAPGGFNQFGEFEPGPVVETIFPARVLPLSNSKITDFVGGVSLLERLKVYVPRGIARRRGQGDALTWHGDALTWNGDPLRWGGGDGALIADDSIPFLAAFEDRQADALVYAGILYTVEESQDWRALHASNCTKGNLMRWPWSKPERRESGGDFSDAVVRLDRSAGGRHGGGCVQHGGGRGGRRGAVEGLRERRGGSGALGGRGRLSGLSGARWGAT